MLPLKVKWHELIIAPLLTLNGLRYQYPNLPKYQNSGSKFSNIRRQIPKFKIQIKQT